MKKPDSIASAPPALKSMDYAGLLAEGVLLCQKLGGDIWTDYNEHDPGVTILEQLCYAITELGLRQDLPMADLLAIPPGCAAAPTVLTTGNEILCGAPLTIKDYRKLLYDQVANLKNAWLTRDNGTGLYHVKVETHGKELNLGDEAEALITLSTAVHELLHQNRNLGDDFASIKILEPFPITVLADVEIDVDASPSLLLAQIMFDIQNHLIPFPQVHPTEQAYTANKSKPYEELFDGPALDLGIINDDTLTEWNDWVTVEELARIISKTTGVQSVSKVRLEVKCLQENVQDKNKVKVPEGKVPRLEPSVFKPQESYPIRILRHGTPCLISPDRVFRRLFELQREIKDRETLSGERSKNDRYRRVASGVFRPLDAYYSIQRHFPATYHIGPSGPGDPLQRDPKRRTQAAQLKAYLLFFEQLLADYAAQIANARDLFSLAPMHKESYFSQSLVRADNLDDQPPDLLKYDLFAVTPPAPVTAGRYVVYLTDPERSGAIRLRSREAASAVEAELLRESMLHYGVDEANYMPLPLPNGEWHLTLQGADRATLAFGGERFHTLDAVQLERLRLAQQLAALTRNPAQCERELRLERRDRIHLRLSDEDGRTLLSADHHSEEQQQRCVYALLEHGRYRNNYQIQALGNGDLRLLLLGPDGEKLMNGEEHFTTVAEAHAGARHLGQLVTRLSTDRGLRERLLCLDAGALVIQTTEADGLKSYKVGLNKLAKDMDEPVWRRNRFLDHLLARVGESFDHAALASFDPRTFGERDGFYQELLGWKQTFLRNYPDLGGRRSIARNYTQPDGRSQLERRLLCLLGMMGTRTDLDIFAASATPPPYTYRRVRGAVSRNDVSSQRWVFDSKHPNILEILLKNGIERARYEVQPVGHGGAVGVSFKWPDNEAERQTVLHAGSKQDAEAAIDALTQQLANLVRQPEQVYAGEDMLLVEHILLQSAPRPDGQTASRNAVAGVPTCDEAAFFKFKISLFFPDWPLRFQNPGFRLFAERTVADNCPAHLDAHCYWLRAGEMAKLKKLHRAWIGLRREWADPKTAPAVDKMDTAAKKLRVFIQHLDKEAER